MSGSIAQSLAAHDKDYKAAAWTDYTVEELYWWVRLFTKRARMRSNPEKKAKDIYDAKNYLDMLNAALKSGENCGYRYVELLTNLAEVESK